MTQALNNKIIAAAGITLLHTTNQEEIIMQEKINELSVVIAEFLHNEDPEEFSAENSGDRAEILADKLAKMLEAAVFGEGKDACRAAAPGPAQ